MARLTPLFSAGRSVRDYTELHYLPAASAYRLRSANNGAVGRQVVDWQQTLKQKWAKLRFGDVKVETNGEQHNYEVQVYLNDLHPDAVRVELYADGIDDKNPIREEMQPARQLVGASGGVVYRAAVSASRPLSDYTARIIPYFEGVAVPLEIAHILWQRQ